MGECSKSMLKESNCSRERKRSRCETAQLLPERRRLRSVIRDAASETGQMRRRKERSDYAGVKIQPGGNDVSEGPFRKENQPHFITWPACMSEYWSEMC